MKYLVKRRSIQVEEFVVEADTPEEAERDFADGELVRDWNEGTDDIEVEELDDDDWRID